MSWWYSEETRPMTPEEISKYKQEHTTPYDYMEKAKDMYDPYVKRGDEAYNQLNPKLSEMFKDPAAYLDSLMKGYQPSESYQQKFGAMSQAAGNTAAAGGMRGSLGDIQQQAGLSQSLMGDDMQQWLQNVLGVEGKGMLGLQDFYNKGYGASSDMANVYNQMGGLKYNQDQQKQKSNNDMMQMVLSLVGTIGGALLGGPAGAAGGGALAKFLTEYMNKNGGGNTGPYSGNSNLTGSLLD